MRKFVLFLLFLLCACTFVDDASGRESEYLVKKVISGDTIQLESGEIVRYLGINAPELYRRKEGGAEFYAREALKYNKKLVFMKKVRIEYDVEKKDSQGRLLGYVFVKSLFVNGELVKLGYARAVVKPPNVKYRDLLVDYQKKAAEQEKGLWQEKKRDSEESYIGNKRSYQLHRPSCKLVGKIPEKNRIIFRSRADAIRIGYVPCKQCKP
jgi:micrococcal nuclease